MQNTNVICRFLFPVGVPFDLCSNIWFVLKVLWHFGCILYKKMIFWISDSESVYLTVYGNIVKNKLFDIFEKKKRVWPRSVNNWCTNCFWYFWGLLVLNGPLADPFVKSRGCHGCPPIMPALRTPYRPAALFE